MIEKGFDPNKINELYRKASVSLGEFDNGKKQEKSKIEEKNDQERAQEQEKEVEITVLDTFAIPEEFLKEQKTFLQWFEPRFFKLDDDGIKRFNKRIREASDFIESQPFVLSPKEGEKFPIATSVKQQIEKGFNNPEQIRSFLKKVAIKNTPKTIKKFFSPDRNSTSGSQRLAVCRILSVAYALEYIKKSNDLKKFFEYSRFVLGRTKGNYLEGGILSTLITEEKLNIFQINDENEFDILEWVKKQQTIKGCHLNNIGAKDKKRSYYIPKVEISFKDGLRGLLKVMRDPKRETGLLNDFLRLRFIFDDNMELPNILEMMHDLEEEAEVKKDPQVKIEFKEINYLTPEERMEYFPEKLEEKKELGKDENRTGNLLKNIRFDQNVSSGSGYKNLSAKIKLLNNATGEEFFGFEIQFLRETEYKNNERMESKANHFLLEMKQIAMFISRFNGKLTREEFIEKLKEYIEENINPNKFPEELIDDVAYNLNGKEGESVVKDFRGAINQKAKALFDFLVEVGVLRKVAQNFPSKRKPPVKTRKVSKYYLHEQSMYRILEFLKYHKKEDKKKTLDNQ